MYRLDPFSWRAWRLWLLPEWRFAARYSTATRVHSVSGVVLLAAVSDPYLDGSGKVFQKCSWHLGNRTHAWGETYGFKTRRLFAAHQPGASFIPELDPPR